MIPRRQSLHRVLMLLVLLIYEAVTVSAWAASLPSVAVAQTGDAHAHCQDALEEAVGSSDQDMTHSDSKHPHSSTDGCCKPGACHCAFSTPPGSISLVSERVPALYAASIASREHAVALAPKLPRHFRPPIQ